MDKFDDIFEQISFAGSHWVLLIPCVLMLVDVLTGIIHAWSTGHLKSYRMREGLGRKFGELSVLVIGAVFTVGLNMPPYVMRGFSIYIIVMELVSICENLNKMGVKIPKIFLKALGELEETIQKDSSDDTKKEEKTDV